MVAPSSCFQALLVHLHVGAVVVPQESKRRKWTLISGDAFQQPPKSPKAYVRTAAHQRLFTSACAGLRILISGEVKQGWSKRAFWSRECNAPLSISSLSWRPPLLCCASDVQSEHLHLFAASFFPDSQHIYPVRLQKKRRKKNFFSLIPSHFSWQLNRKEIQMNELLLEMRRYWSRSSSWWDSGRFSHWSARYSGI